MSSDDTKKLNTDEVLASVGDFGRYQWRLLILFSIVNILCSFHYFSQTFLSLSPLDYQCANSNGSLTYFVDGYKNPINLNDKCDSDYKYCEKDNIEFDMSYGFVSVISELQWICDNAWKQAFSQSMYFLGSVVGTIIFGILSDRVGRLYVMVAANIAGLIGNLITALAYTFEVYSTGRFISGLATDSNFFMMYVIVAEYVRPSMRTFGLNAIIGVFYTFGSMILPWIAVLVGHWRPFLLIISLPLGIIAFFPLVIVESASWLLSRQKKDKTIKCYEEVAKVNGKMMPDCVKKRLQEYEYEEKPTVNFLHAFKTPRLKRKMIILTCKAIIKTVCYDGIARNINGLALSPFVIFSATSATILPGSLVILWLQDTIGRKSMACSSFLICGLFTIVAGVILSSVKDPDIILTMAILVVARFGIVVAYNSAAQYAVELIPTEVRGQGVSFIHVAGYAATFFSPYIVNLANYNISLPYIVLGMLALLGSFCCLFLPETVGRELPQTLVDGEEFGKDETLMEFYCWNKKHVEETDL